MKKKLIIGVTSLVLFSGVSGVYAGTLLKTPRGTTYYSTKENVTHSKYAVTINKKSVGETVSIKDQVYIPIKGLPKDTFKSPTYNKKSWSYNIDSIVKTINDPTKLNQVKMNADLYNFHKDLHILNDRLFHEYQGLMMWDEFFLTNYNLSGMQEYENDYNAIINNYNNLIDREKSLFNKYQGKKGFYQWDVDKMDQQLNSLSEAIDVMNDAYNKLNTFISTNDSTNHQLFLSTTTDLNNRLINIQSAEFDIFNAYYNEIMSIK